MGTSVATVSRKNIAIIALLMADHQAIAIDRLKSATGCELSPFLHEARSRAVIAPKSFTEEATPAQQQRQGASKR